MIVGGGVLLRVATLLKVVRGQGSVVARHGSQIGGRRLHHLLPGLLDYILGVAEDLITRCHVLAVSRDLLLLVVILYVLHRLVILSLILRPCVLVVSLMGNFLRLLGLLDGLILFVFVGASHILW